MYYYDIKAKFSESSVSHDSSEIIMVWWSKTGQFLLNIYVETMIYVFFSGFFW